MDRHGNVCRIRYLMVAVAVVALLLSLDSLPGGRACGEYQLLVHLNGPPNRRIVAVAAESVGSLQRARDFLLCCPEPITNVEPVAWVPGQPFSVRVPCGARTSFLSMRRMQPWQWRAIVLRVDFDEGTRQFYAWEIPDQSRSRQVTVSIP